MMGKSPRCYIQSFVEMCPPVLEKKIFKVFTIYGHDGHLGHEAWTIYTNFPSPFPRRLHRKFGFNWPSGFGGEDFKMVDDDNDNNDDGRRSMGIL